MGCKDSFEDSKFGKNRNRALYTPSFFKHIKIMWFVDDPSDVEPIRAGQEAEPELWLVEGKHDDKPMPLKQVENHRAPKRRLGAGTSSTPKAKKAAEDEAVAKALAAAAEAEKQAADEALPPMRPISRKDGPVRLALVGATGLVGRSCTAYVAAHPELGFTVSHHIGSSASAGKKMSEVAGEKEAILRAHYGESFWDSSEAEGIGNDAVVCDTGALFSEGPGAVDVVLSFLAPRFGHLEDRMIAEGFRVVSISPHARMAHPLLVPVVNANANGARVDLARLRCAKSPNCCSVGSSVALLPLVDHFTVQEVFITTFQTLSGRGDALYPADRVVGNVYPIGATEERTEEYIAAEVSRVFEAHPKAAGRLPRARCTCRRTGSTSRRTTSWTFGCACARPWPPLRASPCSPPSSARSSTRRTCAWRGPSGSPAPGPTTRPTG